MDALKPCYKILSWNVHGLNNVAKREEVKQVISLLKPDLLCLQETKLEALTSVIVRNTLGADYDHNILFQPAQGTRGGSSLPRRSQDSIFRLLNVLLMLSP
jgi:exonuclease III